jgi:hypothetical protein
MRLQERSVLLEVNLRISLFLPISTAIRRQLNWQHKKLSVKETAELGMT